VGRRCDGRTMGVGARDRDSAEEQADCPRRRQGTSWPVDLFNDCHKLPPECYFSLLLGPLLTTMRMIVLMRCTLVNMKQKRAQHDFQNPDLFSAGSSVLALAILLPHCVITVLHILRHGPSEQAIGCSLGHLGEYESCQQQYIQLRILLCLADSIANSAWKKHDNKLEGLHSRVVSLVLEGFRGDKIEQAARGQFIASSKAGGGHG
jgi:hypothetical protein